MVINRASLACLKIYAQNLYVVSTEGNSSNFHVIISSIMHILLNQQYLVVINRASPDFLKIYAQNLYVCLLRETLVTK